MRSACGSRSGPDNAPIEPSTKTQALDKAIAWKTRVSRERRFYKNVVTVAGSTASRQCCCLADKTVTPVLSFAPLREPPPLLPPFPPLPASPPTRLNPCQPLSPPQSSESRSSKAPSLIGGVAKNRLTPINKSIQYTIYTYVYIPPAAHISHHNNDHQCFITAYPTTAAPTRPISHKTFTLPNTPLPSQKYQKETTNNGAPPERWLTRQTAPTNHAHTGKTVPMLTNPAHPVV